LNYELTYKNIPPGVVVDYGALSASSNGSWGVHGRILPFIEQMNMAVKVDVNRAWDNQMAIHGVRIPIIQCPSDPKSLRARLTAGKPTLYPTNYGFNYGTWFIYDPITSEAGDGLFYPNSFLILAAATDGTSNTALLSEVTAWQPYYRNGGTPSMPIPIGSQALLPHLAGCEFKDTGHTEWPDGRVHHSGFTAVLGPNTKLISPVSGVPTDVDYNSWQEGRNGATGSSTYAAITSRSYHVGIVQVGMLDGSVRAVPNQIAIDIWQAMATRSGGEVSVSVE
jgi:hypothetical protein